MRFSLHQRALAFRAVGVLCIVLIFCTGFVTAVHFHRDAPNSTDHSCTICALVHSGVVPVEAGPILPVFSAAETVEVATPQSHSRAVVCSFYIRPPPLV